MLTPYDYQDTCLGVLDEAREQNHDRALVVMASGLGKTALAGFDVRKWVARNPSARVMYLCHQNEILKQGRVTFQDVVDGSISRYGYYHGETKERNSQFLFASFQTMREHYRSFARDAFDYIIVDESHHTHASTYRPVVEYFKPKFLLGITATPDRGDLQDIRTVFGREVYSLNLPEALARGYLTPVDYWLITDELVKLGSIENPYKLSMRDLNQKVFATKRDEEIVDIIGEKSAYINHPRIMTFCRSIKHAERFHESFRDSFPIHSRMHPDEQTARLEAFKRGQVGNIITVDKFNEGIDLPEVNIVVFLRSTMSYTIFYQQLGRGLRRCEGKERMLALDFVGNCERIRMIDTLYREVELERAKIRQAENASDPSQPTVVGFGKFHFTEIAQDILQILERAERNYSRESLVEQLQLQAKRLRRTPRTRDIKEASKVNQTVSLRKFIECFGSFNNALEEAGFSVNQTRLVDFTESSLIVQLQKEARRLKRTPSQQDIKVACKAKRTASAGVFARTFGSHNKALEAAGFSTLRTAPKRPKASLIVQLRREAKLSGKTPRRSQVVNANTFIKTFGSWESALEAAGLSPNLVAEHCSNETLITQLQEEARLLGRVPHIRDIKIASKAKRTVSDMTFARRFGSYCEALKAAGLSTARVSWACPKEKLIIQLQAEAKRLGRTPTINDIKLASKAKRTASWATFARAFVLYSKALKAAGLQI